MFGTLAYDPATGLPIAPDALPDVGAPLIPAGPTTPGTRFGNLLFGAGGLERVQTWPEKLVRSAVTLPGDVLSGEQPILPPGLRREDYTDAPPPPGLMVTAQPNDPAYERAQDLAGMAGGGMMFGRLGPAEATLGSGPVMRRHSMIENADLLKELANQRRARGEATGKSAPGWDFKRPDAAKGSWDDLVARTKAGWEADKARAVSGFEDVVPPKNPSPYLTPDDHAFLASGQFLSDSAAPGAPIAALEHAPKFYSGAERVVEAIPQAKMTGDQWLGTLNNRGVKPEEMDWTGLRGFLAERGDQPVTKAEVAGHLGTNKLELGEVHKGKTDIVTRPNPEEPHILEVYHPDDPTGEINGMWGEIVKGKDGKFSVNVPEIPRRSFASQAEAESYISDNSQLGSNTKFHDYQLPGGENYREKLMTLPSKDPSGGHNVVPYDEAAHGRAPRGTEFVALSRDDRPVGFGGTIAEALEDGGAHVGLRGGKLGVKQGVYQSSHWDEPNVLVHRRTNEREVAHPLSPEELQAVDTRKAAQRLLDGLSERQAATMRDISETVRPLEKARQDQIRADMKAKKISGRDGIRALEEYHPHPEIVPLQEKLQRLRSEEDAIRAGLPLEPKNSSRSLHIEEIQSDWHQAGRRNGYRGANDGRRSVAEIDRDIDALRDVAEKQGPLETSHDWQLYRDNHPEWVERDRQLSNERMRVSDMEENGAPDAPFKKNWHELALKDAIREAAEKGLNRISWTPGEAQAARYDLSRQIDGLSVTRQPNGNYSLSAKPKGVNAYTHDVGNNIPENKLGDFVGKEMAEKITKQEAAQKNYEAVDLKVGGEGMKGFYDKMIPDALNKIGKPHGVKVQTGETLTKDNILPEGGRVPADRMHLLSAAQRASLKPKTAPVHYMDIPQSLKDQALKKGFSLFEDAAATGAPLAAAERPESPADAYHALIDAPVGRSPASAYHSLLDPVK